MADIRDDLDRSITAEAYRLAQEEFIAACELVGVPADRIGFFGNVGFPGISDLDALVVAPPEKLRTVHRLIEEKRSTDPAFGFCFWHNPVYVLESIVEYITILHTLNGLIWNDTPSTNSVEYFHNPAQIDKLLHVIWYCFLLHTWAIRRVAATQSFRTLLLIHRNLEYSYRHFLGASQPQARLIPSDELRAVAFAQPDKCRSLILGEMDRLEAAASAAFDNACEMLASVMPAVQRGRGRLVLSRTAELYRATATRIDYAGDRVILEANPLAFEAGRAYLYTDQVSGPFCQYVRASEAARRAYQSASLPQPFITPFSVTDRPLVRFALRVRGGWLMQSRIRPAGARVLAR